MNVEKSTADTKKKVLSNHVSHSRQSVSKSHRSSLLLSRFLLRLRVYPMQPHVIRGFLLERTSSIQYGYRKSGTHARVFSRTLAHGNSKIEIRQLKIKGKKSRKKEWMWKEAQWPRKSPVNLNVKSHLRSSSHVSPSRSPVSKSISKSQGCLGQTVRVTSLA